MRGWGRGLRNAVAGWYVNREAGDLAHQAVKYQQRDGWSHGDLLRLAHPKAPSPQHDAVGALPKFIEAFERVKQTANLVEVVKLIDEFDLPREAIPTQWLNEAKVWEALLERMPMTAMVRNLGKMTSIGLVKPFSDAKKLVLRKLKG